MWTRKPKYLKSYMFFRKEVYLPQANNNISLIIRNLRTLAKEEGIRNSHVLIPDKCERYGFAEGSHNLGNLLLFLADILEE